MDLKAIRIQYKGEHDVNWNLAKEYVVNKCVFDTAKDNELLPSGGVVYFNFPMSNTSALFPDQTYQFRAITVSSTYGSAARSPRLLRNNTCGEGHGSPASAGLCQTYEWHSQQG
jgi:hypothetical protein